MPENKETFPANKTEQLEQVESQAEQEPIVRVKKLREVFDDYGFKIESEKPDTNICQELRKFIGDKQAEIAIAENNKGEKFYLMTIPYAKGLSAVLMIENGEITKLIEKDNFSEKNEVIRESEEFDFKRFGKKLAVKDLIYVSQNEGKSFNLRQIIHKELPIILREKMKTMAFGGANGIEIPPIGQYYSSPPRGPRKKLNWNLFRIAESITHFHEVGHCQQWQKLGNAYYNLETSDRENDAWKFALKIWKELKLQGLEMLYDLSGKQILNIIEGCLATYDVGKFRHGKPSLPQKEKEFASKYTFNAWPKENRNNCFLHILRLLYASAKIAKEDPKMLSDALLYKGTPKLERKTLQELLEK